MHPSIEQAMTFARKAHLHSSQVGYFDQHVIHVYEKVCDYTADLDTQVAAILHDVVEDTDMTLADIKAIFGSRVASLVDNVTAFSFDEKTGDKLNRKMRNLMTYHKIRSDPASLMIKICDRWHNATRSLEGNSKQGEMYAKEYYTFKCALWTPGIHDELWTELDSLHVALQQQKSWNKG